MTAFKKNQKTFLDFVGPYNCVEVERSASYLLVPTGSQQHSARSETDGRWPTVDRGSANGHARTRRGAIRCRHPPDRHGESYNWDIFLSGVANLMNGMLGLPWLVASTVPCMVHLNNLAEKDAKGNIVSVQETRLTNLGAHSLVGFSLLALKLLKQIPLPVLLGVFLFMGLSSLPSIQMWDRFLMLMMEPSQYPDTDYTKYIDKKRIHLFTFWQIVFFLGVFVIQNIQSIAIVFPFMTLLCIPGRMFFLSKIFEGWELLLLDGENEQIERWIALKEGKEDPMKTMPEDDVERELLEEAAEERNGGRPVFADNFSEFSV